MALGRLRTGPPCIPIRTSLASYSNAGPTYRAKRNCFYSLFSPAVIHDLSLFLSLESSHGRSVFIDLNQTASLRGNVTDPKRYSVIGIVVINYLKLFYWQTKKTPLLVINTNLKVDPVTGHQIIHLSLQTRLEMTMNRVDSAQ